MKELSGKERLVQHLGIDTISLEDIKAYIGVVSSGSTGGAPVSDTVVKIVSAVAIGGHRVVVQINGLVTYADSTIIDHINKVVGITVDAVNDGGEANIQFRGYMEEISWNWQLDKPIFLGMNGLLTQIVPTVGFSQQIATPISATKLLINIQDPIAIGD